MSKNRVAGLAAIALAFSAGLAQAQSITFLTEQNPPFNFSEGGKPGGKPAGISTDIVNEMVKRAGVAAKFEVLAWDRAYRRAQSDKDTCLYSTARLENRENLFTWIGPIATNKWVLVAKDDFAGTLKNVADARKYKIGAVRTDAKAEYLRAKAATNISEFDNEAQIPPALLLKKGDPGRIDLWATGLYTYKSVAERAKVAGVKPVLALAEEDLYIACSPRTSGDAFKRLVAANQSMRKDGTSAKLFAEGEKRFVK